MLCSCLIFFESESFSNSPSLSVFECKPLTRKFKEVKINCELGRTWMDSKIMYMLQGFFKLIAY